jgi:hypothetical protein
LHSEGTLFLLAEFEASRDIDRSCGLDAPCLRS